jgi:hypothetical protein
MSVVVDGQERHSWPVSTGLTRYDTPTGSYTPFRLEKDHFSKEWDDAPMPHSIFFTSRGHAIHGSDATQRLGSPASHGCIRLSRENAAILFDLVTEQGLEKTKVVVTGEHVTVATGQKDGEAKVTAGKTDRAPTAERGSAVVARKTDRAPTAERGSAVVARKTDRAPTAERESAAVARKRDRVQTAAQKLAALPHKKAPVRIVEGEQRKRRTMAERGSRGQGWAGETRRRVVVQSQYPYPQPFWFPFSYGASN